MGAASVGSLASVAGVIESLSLGASAWIVTVTQSVAGGCPRGPIRPALRDRWTKVYAKNTWNDGEAVDEGGEVSVAIR